MEIFTGDESGLLKRIFVPYHPRYLLTSRAYVARKNGIVEYLDENGEFHNCFDMADGRDSVMFTAMDVKEDKIYAASDSGLLKIFSMDNLDKEMTKLSLGKDLSIVRTHQRIDGIFATGGKERDLEIFDLGMSEVPIFKAKNVKNDKLDLRVPIWITDLQFVSDNHHEVLTATAHKQLKMYDTRVARRPISTHVFSDSSIKKLVLVPGTMQVLYADSSKNMNMVDLRQMKVMGRFKGFAGTVTDMFVPYEDTSCVVSVSLDRFVRVHDLQSRNLVQKIYAKQRLSCVFARDLGADNAEEEEDEKIWDDLEEVVEDEGAVSVNNVKRKSSDKSKAQKKHKIDVE